MKTEEQFLVQRIREKDTSGKYGTNYNEMQIEFDAVSVNEAFARTAVASFLSPLNPTLEELSDVKTAVSEAVTNAVIHGYDEEYYQQCTVKEEGHPETDKFKVYIHCILDGDVLHVEIWDKGKGIANVELAMEPLYTSKPELDRSGMGFAFMEAFMDDLEVISEPGFGTTVLMKKKIGVSSWIGHEE
jgi:stage II sporulation protein AB (anti-sigma F factor)